MRKDLIPCSVKIWLLFLMPSIIWAGFFMIVGGLEQIAQTALGFLAVGITVPTIISLIPRRWSFDGCSCSQGERCA